MEKTISPIHIGLYLYYYGDEKCRPCHSWGPGMKTHYKIHFVRSGKGILRIRDTTHTISKGQMFICCPHELVYYEADKDEPWDYVWVAFDGLHVDGYLKRANLSADSPVLTISDTKAMEKLFEQLLAISEPTNEIFFLRTQASIYQFFALLMENSVDTQRKPVHSEVYVEQVMRYVQMNYPNKVTVSGIAEHVGLNHKYLSTLFRSATHSTIKNYIIQYRMDVACGMLKDSKMNISSIALSVGYSDSLLFSKMFKKHLKCSPTEYREMLNKPTSETGGEK